jgi:hypothetical protein
LSNDLSTYQVDNVLGAKQIGVELIPYLDPGGTGPDIRERISIASNL